MVKMYKGFNKDMTCRGFQFEEGETYTEDEAVICESGFHACEDVLDCFSYYAPGGSVYHEIELDDIAEDTGGKSDTKRCGKTIKIGAALDVAGICKAHFEYVKAHCDPAKGDKAGYHGSAQAGNRGSAQAGDCGSAQAGDHGSAQAGNRGSAQAGYHGSAQAGYHGSAQAGDRGSAQAGDRGSAQAGDHGSAQAGDRGSAQAGYHGSAQAGYHGSAQAGDCGSAQAGDCGSALSLGSAAVGVNGIACARNECAKVRGGMGALLIAAIESETSYDIVTWAAGVVDGKKLKPDTWYTVRNGEFVEADG